MRLLSEHHGASLPRQRHRHSRAAHRITTALTIGVLALPALAGCAASSHTAHTPTDDHALTIVASTPIIADLAHNIAPNATIHSLIPPGVDPHSFEPSMAQLRDIAHADIAFSNGLLLEHTALTQHIDANLPQGAPHIALGTESIPFGARPLPLVEDIALATVWLGLRVDGRADPTSTVRFEATQASGPGDMAAFTTGTFGEPRPWIATKDGITSDDQVQLPTNAHTHMSWGFTQPGIYTLDLTATLLTPDGPTPLGDATLTFSVGTDPHALGRTILDSGHADLSAHLDGGLTLHTDTRADLDPTHVVIAVPDTTTTQIPDNKWRFLADPGDEVRILAQAVIGTHVHGEIDPHMWHSVPNAIAYSELIAEELSRIDPQGAPEYRANAERTKNDLDTLDRWIRHVIASIPEAQRSLVTAHDSFGYYADTYGLTIAGFVAPNPTLEPSAFQLTTLARVLKASQASGVFVEAGSASHLGELTHLARTTGKSVCELYSDTLSATIPTYRALMEFNTRSIKSCLDPESWPAWPLSSEESTPTFKGNQ